MELFSKNIDAVVEAVFFMESESRSVSDIEKIIGAPKESIEEAIIRLKEKYIDENTGIELVEFTGGWIIRPKKNVWEILKPHYGKKTEGRLSRAAIETLSIIAYNQPVTRAEIEHIRGVASADTMIKMLVDRGVIEETGTKDAPGRPTLYRTTKEFLQLFKLNSIAELPQLDEADAERFRLAN
ncbi:MAG: SMC-Scp complex subunit ScpB [Treponemataceae bacterium]|nr:MAG: SMC-Scp complex subunit ScpB [Treponemataceae bacterium]